MHRSLKFALAIAFVFIAVYIVMDADDSDAISGGDLIGRQTVTNEYGEVWYDFVHDSAATPYYGTVNVAFVSPGYNGSVKEPYYNILYDQPTLKIESSVTYHWDGKDPSKEQYDGVEFKVVGVRNNAFKGNAYTVPGDETTNVSKTTNTLKKVIIPATVQAIGVTANFQKDEGTGGFAFGSCYALKEIVIEGPSELESISTGSFFRTNIEVLDLSECINLTFMGNKSLGEIGLYGTTTSPLKFVDLSRVKTIASDLFRDPNTGNVSIVQNIVMPTDPSANINTSALRGLVLYDENNTKIYDFDAGITDVSKLIGKQFKKLEDGSFKQGYLATYETNTPGKTMLNEVFLNGEEIPNPEGIRTDGTSVFWEWRNTDTGEVVTHMPRGNISLTAYWKAPIPTPVEKTYNGEYQRPYGSDMEGYTVSNAGFIWVGPHTSTFKLTQGTVWADDTTEDKTVDWTIVPKPITVTGIKATGKTYDGNTNAPLSYGSVIYYGLVKEADKAKLSVTAKGTFPDKYASNVAKEVTISDIVLGGELKDQYVVVSEIIVSPTETHTTQTVDHAILNKKEITVQVHDNHKTYGDADPIPISTWEWEGGVGPVAGDGYTVVLTRVTGEDWGPKKINFAVNFEDPDNEQNYTVKGEPGNFTINRKHIEIKADNKQKELHADDPVFTYSMYDANGVLVDPPIAISFTVTFARETGEEYGKSYVITPSGESEEGNYYFTYGTGSLKIISSTRANIVADSIEITYGDVIPTVFTATYFGPDPALNPEDLHLQFSHDEITGVGTYELRVTGDSAHDPYANITYVSGWITVKHKIIYVDADDKYKTYGEKDPELTFSVTGLVDPGDKDLLKVTLSRAEGEDWGFYRITPSGAVLQGNYEIKYDFGSFDIKRKTVEVVPNKITKIYGDADPELTVTIDGLVGSDKIAYTIVREPGENVDMYDIETTGVTEQGNYIVVFHTGEFKIDFRTATVTGDELYKIVGEADPELTAKVDGVLEGDSIEYTVSREPGEELGKTYKTTPSGVYEQGNYKVTYVPGSLTIESGYYTITINVVGKGTVTPSTYGCAAGTVVTLTNTPLTGWDFKGYESDDVTINDDGTFVMIHKNITITATFEYASTNEPVSYASIAIAAFAACMLIAFIIPKH